MNHLYSLALSFCCLFFTVASLSAQDFRQCQEDAVVSVAFSGDTTLTTCTDDDVMDRIRFQVMPFRQAFAYVVVDEADVIQYIGFSNFINFDVLPAGALRVYAFSNHGRITADVGDDFTTATLSEPCAGLTQNFVSVNNGNSEPVAIESAQDVYDVTVGDGTSDLITVTATAANATFVITDTEGNVLGTNTTGVLDFDNADAGTCYVYAFAGTYPVATQNVSELTDLTGCGTGLSANFIVVNRSSITGGTITTAAGETEVRACPGDDEADLIEFVVNGSAGGTQRLIITDDQGVIIGLPTAFVLDFEETDPGVCRAYGVTFTGEWTAQIGEPLADSELSDGVAVLTDNFVTVTRETPVGGTVLTAGGESQITTCPGDGVADLVEVVSSGASGGEVAYLITNDQNEIINFSTEPSFDVEGAGTGVCRIWALVYQGELTLSPGLDAATADLATGCFALSEDFVTVVRTTPAGGTVSTDAGETEVTICSQDGVADPFTFVSEGAAGESFVFVITNDANEVLATTATGTFDFEGAPAGVCRVWGLSYNGALTVDDGDDVTEATLADNCFSLSDNFVTVVREDLAGGTVRLTNGATAITICPTDGISDVLNFENVGATGDTTVFVVTDDAGVILDFPFGSALDFEGVPVGVCRIYSVTYRGELTAAEDDDFLTAQLATECFARSENFIRVVRQLAETGPISTEAGETEIFACPGDAVPDLVRFDSTGTTLSRFNYVITDTNNVVFRVAFTDQLNFETLPEGTCRVHGLGYDGVIIAAPGDTAGIDQLASQCSALSTNFVTVTKLLPVGGTVATTDGATDVMVCSLDGVPDPVAVTRSGATGVNFTYVLTTDENVILSLSDSGVFDFDDAPFGVCRIWSLSYVGELTAAEGDDAATAALASQCAALSDNFVTVTREDVEGGSVALADGRTEFTTCVGDGEADVLSFVATDVSAANYQFLVTDEDNTVLALVEGASFDFEQAGLGVCRVWGVGYAGTLTVSTGDNAATATLADGCFDLSDNFITVNRTEPASGVVSLTDGTTTADVCAGGTGATPLALQVAAFSGQFTYVLTQDSLFVALVAGDTLDFNELETGTYAVYGLAYAGDLTLVAGQNVLTTAVATSCFALSSNRVTVNVTRVDGGTIAGNGADELYFCPDNFNDGLVNLTTTSSLADANYRYVIATATNVIIGLVDEGATTFDFGSLPLMELKVFGISYTGEFLAGPGFSLTQSQLATGCVGISENCIRVLNDTPDGGTVSLDNVPQTGVFCTVDGDSLLRVSTTSTSLTGYAVVVTDTNNIVQLVSLDPAAVALGSLPNGPYRVYGLAYTGNVVAQPGDDLAVVPLADNCYEISDNFVEVTNGGSIDGGRITNLTTAAGGDTITFCTAAGDAPIAVVGTDQDDPGYRYIITDENGDIRAGNLPGSVLVFEVLPPGTYRIYGFSFTGVSLANINRNVETDFLSSECFAVSENFLTVIYDDPEAGEVTTAAGETDVEIEIVASGDDATAIVAFQTTSASASDYAYVITDEDNTVLNVSEGAVIDFGPAGVGVCRVWGLSYSGEVLLAAGDTLAGELTDGCFELTTDFVTVTRVDEIPFGEEGEHQGADVISGLTLTAFPNPVNGNTIQMNLESLGELAAGRVFVRDLNGTAYAVRDLAGGEASVSLQFDVSDLAPGVYFLQYATASGVQTVRFLKN